MSLNSLTERAQAWVKRNRTLTAVGGILAFLLSLPSLISGTWALNSSEPLLQYLSKHYSIQFATFSITWITTPLGLLMLGLILYLVIKQPPQTQVNKLVSDLEAFRVSPRVTEYRAGILRVECLVIDADDGTPIRGARIEAYGPGEMRQATTNREGIAILNIEVGRYTLITRASKYASVREAASFRPESEPLEIRLVKSSGSVW